MQVAEPEGSDPFSVVLVTTLRARELKGTDPFVPAAGAAPVQCVSEPAARRISGAVTWDSSLR